MISSIPIAIASLFFPLLRSFSMELETHPSFQRSHKTIPCKTTGNNSEN